MATVHPPTLYRAAWFGLRLGVWVRIGLRLVAGLGLLCFGGCQSPNESAQAMLRLNLSAGVSSLDPAQARSQNNIWMVSQLYEGLVTLDSLLRPTPALAQHWHISPDGRTYTFTLRPGVLYHRDGCFGPDSTRALRAADFVFSLTRICDPQTASSGQWLFNGRVLGVSEFQAGQADTIAGFGAPNDSTFVIRLIDPFPPFLSLLAMPYAAAVPPEAVAHYGTRLRSQPVGTGPFRLQRWREGQQLVLHRNPQYWQAGLPKLQAVVVRFVPSRLTELAEFLRGELDLFDGLDASVRDELLGPDGQLQPQYAAKYQYQTAPELSTEYLGLLQHTTADAALNPNIRQPWLDPRVRLALSLAIDRQRLVRYLLGGMGTPAVGFTPVGMPGFAVTDSANAYADLRSPWPYDPARAARLLERAGYPRGDQFPPLVLATSPRFQPISEFLQQSWGQLGIRVVIDNLEGAAQRERIYNQQVGLWRASWLADYPDAENFLALFVAANWAPAGPNTTHYKDAEFDKLYAQALRTPQDSLRYPLYHQLEALLARDLPVIPLYHYRAMRLLQPNLRGLPLSPMTLLLDLKYAWKE